MNLVKEIRSKEGEVHFRRWSIFENKWFRIYLHQILKADEDAHEHTHPWNFISWLISGTYIEDSNGKATFRKTGSLLHRKADVPHKLISVSPGCLSLVFAYGKRVTWGYAVNNVYGGLRKASNGLMIVHHEEYRNLKNSGNLM